MSEASARRMVTVINPQGLHARPADMLVRTAKQFGAAVSIKKGNESVDGKSILSLLTLAAEMGCELEISATGDDAQEAVVALSGLFEQGFGTVEAAGNTEEIK